MKHTGLPISFFLIVCLGGTPDASMPAEMPADTSLSIIDSALTDTSRNAFDGDFQDSVGSGEESDGNAAFIDTLHPPKAGTAHAASGAAADTGHAFWKRPYWGVSIGWTLGSYPFFQIWENSLAQKLGDFSLSSPVYLKRDQSLPDSLSDWDTLKLFYRIQEKPNTYNLSFPAGVVFTFNTREYSSWSIDGTFSFLHKTYQASVEDDSSENRVDILQKLGHYVFSIGLTWSRTIPSTYFSIDNADRSSLVLGAAISPVSYIGAKSSVSSRGSGRDTLFSAIRDSIEAQLPRTSAWGFGISWKIGLATLRRHSANAGLTAGLHYVGQWHYFFDTAESDLTSAQDTSTDAPISSLCHRLLIQIELLRGKKPSTVEKPITHEKTVGTDKPE